jgi:hypothetical protein
VPVLLPPRMCSGQFSFVRKAARRKNSAGQTPRGAPGAFERTVRQQVRSPFFEHLKCFPQKRKPCKGRRTSSAFYQRTSVGCANASPCSPGTQRPAATRCSSFSAEELSRRSYWPCRVIVHGHRAFKNRRMKQVELFRWWVRAPGRKRAHLTDFLMDAATANAQYPGARPDPTSRVVRTVREGDSEQKATVLQHPPA